MTQAARWTTGPQRLKPLQAAPTQHLAQVGHVILCLHTSLQFNGHAARSGG